MQNDQVGSTHIIFGGEAGALLPSSSTHSGYLNVTFIFQPQTTDGQMSGGQSRGTNLQLIFFPLAMSEGGFNGTAHLIGYHVALILNNSNLYSTVTTVSVSRCLNSLIYRIDTML